MGNETIEYLEELEDEKLRGIMTNLNNKLRETLTKLTPCGIGSITLCKDCHNDIDQALSAIKDLMIEERIDELINIRDSQHIVEFNDSEYPYWCETCEQLLVDKEDICACEKLTHSRLAELRSLIKGSE